MFAPDNDMSGFTDPEASILIPNQTFSPVRKEDSDIDQHTTRDSTDTSSNNIPIKSYNIRASRKLHKSAVVISSSKLIFIEKRAVAAGIIKEFILKTRRKCKNMKSVAVVVDDFEPSKAISTIQSNPAQEILLGDLPRIYYLILGWKVRRFLKSNIINEVINKCRDMQKVLLEVMDYYSGIHSIESIKLKEKGYRQLIKGKFRQSGAKQSDWNLSDETFYLTTIRDLQAAKATFIEHFESNCFWVQEYQCRYIPFFPLRTIQHKSINVNKKKVTNKPTLNLPVSLGHNTDSKVRHVRIERSMSIPTGLKVSKQPRTQPIRRNSVQTHSPDKNRNHSVGVQETHQIGNKREMSHPQIQDSPNNVDSSRMNCVLEGRRIRIEALTKGIDKAMGELMTTTESFRISRRNIRSLSDSADIENTSSQVEALRSPCIANSVVVLPPAEAVTPKPSTTPPRVASKSPTITSPLVKKWEGRFPSSVLEFGYALFGKSKQKYTFSEELGREMAAGQKYSMSLLDGE